MSDFYMANVGGKNMQIFLRKNTRPTIGKKIVFRKVFIGSPWIKAEVLEAKEALIKLKLVRKE